MSQAELEICVDTAAALAMCLQARVDRVELCSALAVGGLTPAYGFMKLAGRLAASGADTIEVARATVDGIEAETAGVARPQVLAMIRPRSGDFCFSKAETDSMCDDIIAARDAGLDGVVLGAATTDDRLDLPVLHRLCRAADGLQVTLHRVIDLLDDPLLAIDQAIDLGFHRVLTSGGAVRVAEGLLQLSEMHKYANRRIQIMAGAGLNPSLAKLIRQEAGIDAFHASCRGEAWPDRRLSAFGFAGQEGELDPGLIDDYRRSLADTQGDQVK